MINTKMKWRSCVIPNEKEITKALAELIYKDYFDNSDLAYNPEYAKAVRNGIEKFIQDSDKESNDKLFDYYEDRLYDYFKEQRND